MGLVGRISRRPFDLHEGQTNVAESVRQRRVLVAQTRPQTFN